MVNYREDRNRINVNALGSLYLDKVMKKGYTPLIYIGGQMEHRLHTFENRTGITFDPGHGLFDGSYMYEYPTNGTKSNINTLNFADSLVKCIEKSGLEKVDIITEGYGGLVAACASKSDLIQRVVAIHPPILGTPLASNDVILDNLDKLEKSQRILKLCSQKGLANWVTRIVNDYYGFEKDNSLGINNSDILRNIDFSKLTVVGSTLDRENDKRKLACALYDIIYAITGEKSDGVVIYNEETLRKYGINYFTEIVPKNHFDAGSERNLMRYAHKYFDGYEFEETEEVDPNSFIDASVAMPLEDKTSFFDEEDTDKEYESFIGDEDSFIFDKEEPSAKSDDDLDIMSVDDFISEPSTHTSVPRGTRRKEEEESIKRVLSYFKGYKE